MNYGYLADVVEPTELAWRNRLLDLSNVDKMIKITEEK